MKLFQQAILYKLFFSHHFPMCVMFSQMFSCPPFKCLVSCVQICATHHLWECFSFVMPVFQAKTSQHYYIFPYILCIYLNYKYLLGVPYIAYPYRSVLFLASLYNIYIYIYILAMENMNVWVSCILHSNIHLYYFTVDKYSFI